MPMATSHVLGLGGSKRGLCRRSGVCVLQVVQGIGGVKGVGRAGVGSRRKKGIGGEVGEMSANFPSTSEDARTTPRKEASDKKRVKSTNMQ